MGDPKVLNAPERIWLVYGEGIWDGFDATADVDPEDVCWSSRGPEFPSDVGFVRADVHEAEVERLREARDRAWADGYLAGANAARAALAGEGDER